MTTTMVIVDGVEYEVAPLEPERHDRPSPAYPVAITPEVASSWLRYNYRNRHQRKAGKRDYGSDMLGHRYEVNGTTITFSRPLKDGEDENVPAGSVMLVDGQHRLEACVASRAPFVTYVAYGIKPEARRTVDTGIRRQLGDVLAMDGETNAIVLAAVIKRAYFWNSGDTRLAMRDTEFTHTLAEEFLKLHPELRRSTEIAMRTHAAFDLTTGQKLRASVTGLAHWLFMQADQAKAPEFFARVGDGADISIDHPVAVLRRRLVKDRTQKVQMVSRREIYNAPDWQMLCYFIRSWNVYMKGPRSDGSYAEFALVGRNDHKTMPAIATGESIRAEEEAYLNKLEAAST